MFNLLLFLWFAGHQIGLVRILTKKLVTPLAVTVLWLQAKCM